MRQFFTLIHHVIRFSLHLGQSGMLLSVAYLLLLSLAAFLPDRRKARVSSSHVRRFAFLVPAHNEELLLGQTLASLFRVNYLHSLYSVYVVADNCTDHTVEIASMAGATVVERHNLQQRGKGYALQYLLQQIEQSEEVYDAYVICDADTLVDPELLNILNAMLEQGSSAIQVYYTVANWRESPAAALRYAALTLVHYLRPLGRRNLGLSCGLKGNGMCFRADLLRSTDWQSFSIVEDIEYHIKLVESGMRVDFAPNTWVEAIMPNSLTQSTTQNERWEAGRVSMMLKYSPHLFWEGVHEANPVKIDVAIDQVIPPIAVIGTTSTISLLCGLLFKTRSLSLMGLMTLLGLGTYLFSGLLAARAPLKVYSSLLFAPFYLLWKTLLYLKAMLRPTQNSWIRTPRTK